jgi:TPR repeat protein
MRLLVCCYIAALFSCQVALPQTENRTPASQQNDVISLRKAAEGGDVEAQCKLGAIYFLGLGERQDYSEAYFWYDLAASAEIKVTRREDIDELRDDAAKHLPPADLNRVNERVHTWSAMAKQSARGNRNSTASPISDNITGSSQPFADQYWAQKLTSPPKPTEDEGTKTENTAPNFSTRTAGMRKVSEQKSDDGVMRKAAEQGDASAQYNLGLMYASGLGTPQDYTQAAFWFRKAAEQGDTGAQRQLGYLYVQGHGVPQDDAQAGVWLRRAAEGSTSKNNVASSSTSSSADAQIASLPSCTINISFGIVTGTQVLHLAPAFTQKWIKKNQKEHPGLCFSQTPDLRAVNYLVVFSTSQSALNGFEPSLQTSTSTSTTPVYGSGTVTSTSGGMWNYTYNGTATAYTTTTAQVDLPYTLTTNSIYENTYSASGTLISQRWRSFTTQRGGDGYSALGTNLGALIRKVHIKEKLLTDTVEDIEQQTQ